VFPFIVAHNSQHGLPFQQEMPAELYPLHIESVTVSIQLELPTPYPDAVCCDRATAWSTMISLLGKASSGLPALLPKSRSPRVLLFSERVDEVLHAERTSDLQVVVKHFE
jgi:hypothetical protein